jgi:hypothetical protein
MQAAQTDVLSDANLLEHPHSKTLPQLLQAAAIVIYYNTSTIGDETTSLI